MVLVDVIIMPRHSPKLVLASSSPYRVDLLRVIGYEPNTIHPADLNEEPHKGERPSRLAERLATEKAQKVAGLYRDDIVLAADTVAAVGRTSLPKAINEDDARLLLFGFIEELTDSLSTYSHKHLVEI